MVKTIFDMTFEQEKALNNPAIGYRWVAENYRNTYDKTGKIHLYEWEPITFVNTDIISNASNYYQKHGYYTDIDPNKYPTYYEEFWDRWEYRRKNGMVLPCAVDASGGNSDKDLRNIWIPPKMVGHLNFGPIERSIDPDEKSIKDYLDAQIDLKTHQHSKEKELEILFNGLSDKIVAESTFDFPSFWDGHYHTWIAASFAERLGLDIGVVKARRKGFSYIGAWDAFDEYDMYPYSTTLLIAYDLNYLTKDGGLFTLVKRYGDFMNKFTDWEKRRLTNTKSELVSGFKYRGDDTTYGFNSSIICLSAMDNPSCARGKKARKIKYEECGTFPNLLETVGSTNSSAESGGYTTGQSTYWGTVGDGEADYAALKQLAYKPNGYDLLCFNNVYDKDRRGTASCMFFGQYQNYEGAIDKHGNSLYDKAKELHEVKSKIKEENSDLKTFTKWKAERATTLSEALNRGVFNIFSRHSDKINLQINRIEADEFKGLDKQGLFITGKDDEVILMTNQEMEREGLTVHPAIEETAEMLPNDYDFHGCIRIWQEPYKRQVYTEKGFKWVVPEGLYYIWHDPYATDKDSKDITAEHSLGCAYVYEVTNGVTPTRGNRIVASWIGRPDTMDEYNEQLLYLAMYFNTVNGLMFENNRGEVKPFFAARHALRFLMEEPEMLSLKDTGGKRNGNYGITITPARKSKGALLLRDFLGAVISDNKDSLIVKTFLNYVFCKRFLKELANWNSTGNFDCVSTGIVGMYQVRETITKELDISSNEYTHEVDDFFFREHF